MRRTILTKPSYAFSDYFELNYPTEAIVAELGYQYQLTSLILPRIDYWVRSTHDFLVIEAKKADMERGFTQLAVEFIAMDQYIETDHDPLYGAITIGDSWRFGKLVRAEKLIYKDLESFRVPADLADLFQVLSGILLENEISPNCKNTKSLVADTIDDI